MYKELELECNRLYSWCSCGLSKKDPFCDGSHKGTEFSSVKFQVENNGTYKLCLCKKTANAPFCDGSQAQCVGENENK